ncbi:DUF3472 domain-containing protein [Stenotrophomonas pennii]|uniref:DUF3472 domain-containing protein n=1 Tax=Stenotrophomonas lacuserhaii TaxID=2760084 RepID=UPI00320A64C4
MPQALRFIALVLPPLHQQGHPMARQARIALLLIPLALTWPGRVDAVVAGGMASISRDYVSQPGGYLDLQTRITIDKEPGFNGRTYWAHQWRFVGPEGGYVGLQQRSGREKAINFSIWGATGWDATGPARCQFFGHEGKGVQCSMALEWTQGTPYQIRIQSTAQDRWTASVTDTVTGQTRVVATIHAAAGSMGIKDLSEWVEDFAQGSEQHDRCEDVPPTQATFGVPRLEGRIPLRSRPRTYGNCAHIAQVACSNAQVCTVKGNPQAGGAAP